MTTIGRWLSVPTKGSEHGQIIDEYGNNWNVKTTDSDRSLKVDSEVAYRLDFSDPSQSPKVVIEDD